MSCMTKVNFSEKKVNLEKGVFRKKKNLFLHHLLIKSLSEYVSCNAFQGNIILTYIISMAVLTKRLKNYRKSFLSNLHASG